MISLNDLDGCQYYEPFAGGAGAALTLLESKAVSRLHLNDADRRVYSFWRACVFESDRFAERILDVSLTIDEWRRQHDICAKPSKHSQFAIGFAAFFMNRCNRSGVLTGAGPIGGYAQSGTWRLDVRFNRQQLAARILQLGRLRSMIRLSNMDAVDFLKQRLPRGADRKRVFVYLDPPYVLKGQRLYLNAYESQDHGKLSAYLRSQKSLYWFASYDDSPLIRTLYAGLKVCLLPVQYSLQVKRIANELVLAPQYLALPAMCRTMSEHALLRNVQN
jgi:DNA adenine methylase